MSRHPRRNYSAAFKAKVALAIVVVAAQLAAIKGEKTLAELAQQQDVHANQITTWHAQLLEGPPGVFGGGSVPPNTEATVDVKMLHARIGQMTPGNDFFSRRARAKRVGCRAQCGY